MNSKFLLFSIAVLIPPSIFAGKPSSGGGGSSSTVTVPKITLAIASPSVAKVYLYGDNLGCNNYTFGGVTVNADLPCTGVASSRTLSVNNLLQTGNYEIGVAGGGSYLMYADTGVPPIPPPVDNTCPCLPEWQTLIPGQNLYCIASSTDFDSNGVTDDFQGWTGGELLGNLFETQFVDGISQNYCLYQTPGNTAYVRKQISNSGQQLSCINFLQAYCTNL